MENYEKNILPEICSVLNVKLRVADYEGALQLVKNAIESKKQIRMNLCNVHVTMVAQSMPELMTALNHPAAITLPDGMPLVWAMRSWGAEIKDRVYGPDLFELCMSNSGESGFKHFLYGSTEKTLEKLETNLKNKFENIHICDSYSPPFRPLTSEEEEEIVSIINNSDANIVWIGLGAPKQEIFVDKIAKKLNAQVVVAIGAAFDFHAGTVKQAPDWMQDHGLEWLYRLIQEPRRLWFRYCYYNPLFVIKYLIEKTKGRKGGISNNQ